MARRYARRYRRGRIGRRMRKSRVLGKRRRVSKTVKRYVKRAIHRNIENKEIIQYAQNQSLRSAGVGNAPAGIPLIPQMSVGTGSSQMIGNQIKCQRGVIKGFVNLKPYDATTNPLPAPLWVKMWLVKYIPFQGQVSALSSIDFTTFFKLSGGTANFQGNTFDLTGPINEVQWRVLRTKTFRLGATSYTATGPVSSGSYFDNSHMSVPFYFNYGRYIRKTLRFQDTGVGPLNANIYLVIQVVGADGQTETGYVPAEWHYHNHFKFEDA